MLDAIDLTTCGDKKIVQLKRDVLLRLAGKYLLALDIHKGQFYAMRAAEEWPLDSNQIFYLAVLRQNCELGLIMRYGHPI